MPSVAERVLNALAERLDAIRGGTFNNDLQGRVYLSRPSYNLATEEVPAVFLAPRSGGGFSRERKPGTSELSDTTLVVDVVGVLSTVPDSSIAGLRMLADLQAALEIPADKHLRVDIDGRSVNLLSDELTIIDIEFVPASDVLPFDHVVLGVQCPFPHTYGDPDNVE
jgi:hypothetical protein